MTRTNKAPHSPRLVWRTPHTSRILADAGHLSEASARDAHGEELPGPRYSSTNPRTPERIAALGLRAWFKCSVCKRERPTPAGFGSPGYCGGVGYGTDSKTGRAVCYRCCGERDTRDMRETGRAVLYLTPAPDSAPGVKGSRAELSARTWRVGNWPGSLVLPVLSLKRGAHNWRNVERVDFWFVFEGFVWHGIRLGDMDLARCRRTRTEWRNGRAHTPRKSRASREAVRS